MPARDRAPGPAGVGTVQITMSWLWPVVYAPRHYIGRLIVYAIWKTVIWGWMGMLTASDLVYLILRRRIFARRSMVSGFMGCWVV
jgi:hypothetical protein